MTNPKYMSPRLLFAVDKVAEETRDLMAALSKTLRCGWTSYNPDSPADQRDTNAHWIVGQIWDVREALDNLQREMARDGLWPPEKSS